MRGMEQEAKTYQTKPSIRLHPLATGAEPSCEVPMESNVITDPNLNSQLHPLAMATAFSPRQQSFPRLKSRSSQLSKQLSRKERPVK